MKNFTTVLIILLSSSIAWGSFFIENGTVTQAKLSTRGTGSSTATAGQYALSASGSVTTGSSAAIPNNSITITTTGRPIIVGAICGGSTSECGILCGSTTVGDFEILRGGTIISRQLFSNDMPASAFYYIDPQPAGTYTYTDAVAISIGSSVGATLVSLYAYEL
jgi:hypothetical protein